MLLHDYKYVSSTCSVVLQKQCSSDRYLWDTLLVIYKQFYLTDMKSKEQVLREIYENENKEFGQKNKPRNEEPSMFDLLKWQENKDEPWDFKKKLPLPEREPEAKKFGERINHEKSQWKTENQDNYRKIETIKVQNQQLHVQKLDDKTVRNIAAACDCKQPPQSPTIQIHEDPHTNYLVPPNWNPKNQSAYREAYQVKDIRDNNQLMHQLEANSKSFKGHYKPSNPTGNFYYEDENAHKEELQSEEEQEEEEEQIEEQKRMNTKFKKSAKVLDPEDPEDQEKLRRRLQRIKKFQGETRWLANSAFTTYFGKPAWGAYGQGNVKPVIGGVIYGQHMLSHNIQPHRNKNDPRYLQSYPNALRYGANQASIEPEPPRNCREEDRLNPEQIESLKQRNPLTATPFEEVKKKIVDRSGKALIQDLTIKKPDLVNTLRFASEAASENGDQNIHPPPPAPAKPKEKQKEAQKEPPKRKEQKRPQSAAAKIQKETKQSAREDDKKPKKINEEAASLPSKKSEKEKGGKKGGEKKPSEGQEKRVTASDSKQPQNLDDSLAIPDKSSNKFIAELRAKKEKANRLTAKVNQINPSLLVQKTRPPTAQAVNQDLQEVRSFDDKNPPPHYLQQLDPVELNPKYYKGVPSDWLHRIPFAGKKQEVVKNGEYTKGCLDFGY